MRAEQKQTRGQSATLDRLDLLPVVLLLAVGLGVRWLYARAVVFPPLDDPAFYLTTAKNLVSGRGLVVDALWSYQIQFPQVTHPSHEHWMPLTTGLIAATWAIQHAVSGAWQTVLRTGQLPGLILGTLLAVTTYLFGRRVLPGKDNRWVALAAALLIAGNATLSYQSASADSSAPFALVAALALAATVRRPGDERGYFAAGCLIALAYLTRADGLLLLLAVPLAWWFLPTPSRPQVELPDNPAAQIVWKYWPREEGSEQAWRRTLGPSLTNLLDVGVSFFIVAILWLVRNYLAFGTPLPSSVLDQAWLTDYTDTFNYWHHPTWETMLAQGWPAILAQRGQALLHNGRIFLLITFPWGLLALPGFVLLRREWRFVPSIVYGLLLFFVLAIIFPVSSMSGTYYHSLGAVMPYLALAAMYAIQRGIQRLRERRMVRAVFTAVILGFLVLSGAQVIQSLPVVADRHQADKEQFEAAAEWLAIHAAPGDVVMTTQPYTLNLASGHPCIVLPGNEPPEAAWEAAQRYGARFLIITQSFGQYPQILHEQPDPRFRLLEASETTEIYEIAPQAESPTG